MYYKPSYATTGDVGGHDAEAAAIRARVPRMRGRVPPLRYAAAGR